VITIELIYDAGCQHVKHARRNLMVALEKAMLPAHWTEWCRGASISPVYTRRYGSPSILVNGQDVVPLPFQKGAVCRIYLGDDGTLHGAPTADDITRALRREIARSLDPSRGLGPPRPI
jgi:hypothetical protein